MLLYWQQPKWSIRANLTFPAEYLLENLKYKIMLLKLLGGQGLEDFFL